MDQSFMKEKAVMPLVISMAIPMTISMLVNSLYNIIDSFYVAKISEQAMTALSLVYPAQNLLIGRHRRFCHRCERGDRLLSGSWLEKAGRHGGNPRAVIFNILHGFLIGTHLHHRYAGISWGGFPVISEIIHLGTQYAETSSSSLAIPNRSRAFLMKKPSRPSAA